MAFRGLPPQPSTLVRRGPVLAMVGLSIAIAGCSSDHHVLSPAGPAARRVSLLGWGLIITATVVTILVFAILVAALLPGERTLLRRISDRGYLVGLGIVMPMVILLTVSGVTVAATNATPREGDLVIEVVGHQYWWEVRYPGSRAITANEIHIPAGRRVRLELRSDDVIHSFWVPSLAPKIDMIPGQTNHLVLEADEPGTYRGQCAEFCGAQHARMAMQVIADTPNRYEAWVREQAAPAQKAQGVDDGRQTFLNQSCAGCHTVRGTEADGEVGPDLTHLASRRTLAALTIPNDREHLTDWVRDPQDIKDGAIMPTSVLSPSQLEAVVDYLETLQ